MVNGAARTMIMLTFEIFTDLQISIKQISPMPSKDEQNEVHEIFAEFHKLLMTSQTFLTKTTIRTLCSQTQALLQRFWPISRSIEIRYMRHCYRCRRIYWLYSWYQKCFDNNRLNVCSKFRWC